MVHQGHEEGEEPEGFFEGEKMPHIFSSRSPMTAKTAQGGKPP
ncbi:hypothetical protein [Methanoregula sp.]|nr:hypothetical protein [Methanoregula sp.]MDD5143788.1 hypothetical protein [Methanoregula sp.]MDD5144262.1 hypothetical protein [Methanoregula sp.]